MSTNPELPSYEELFGKLDFKKGDDGRSVYSPAAYLTDLLQLLDDNFVDSQLHGRRADIKNLLLNSENTYDTIPYLDIVNEVLEEKVNSRGDVYEDMRTAKYPFNLPFNYENERIKKFLDYLNVSNECLYKSFSRRINSNVVAREYLGLAAEEYNTSVVGNNININIDIEALKECYKLSENESFESLNRVDVFLKTTGISGSELRELLYGNLSRETKDGNSSLNPERVKAGDFFVNYQLDGYAKLDDREEYIIWSQDSGIPIVWYERVNRFIRLAKKIGISFRDLDVILRCCSGNKLDDVAVGNIAVIKQLYDLYELPFDVICSFFGDINILGVGDGEEVQDLFNRIFNLRFADIDKKYILVSDFIPEGYSSYSQLFCSGDILSLSNKEYRIRVGKALGISQGDIEKIVEKFRGRSEEDDLRKTVLDIYDNGEEYGRIELSALSLLFRISKLIEVLDVSYDDLFHLLDILETDPIIRRFSNFDVLVHREMQEFDCYKILAVADGDVKSSIWLVQVLFSLVPWMKLNQFNGEQLKFLLTGKYDVEVERIKEEVEGRKEEKIGFLNHLYQQFKSTALKADLFKSDLFDGRSGRVIYRTLVNGGDGRLVRFSENVKKAAYQALMNLQQISSEDFMGLGLEGDILDGIFNSLILKGYIDTEGNLVEGKLGSGEEFEIETDFSDYRQNVLQLIVSLIVDEVKSTIYGDFEVEVGGEEVKLDFDEVDFDVLDVGIYPSNLELEVFAELSEEKRQELYDNLIVNGYINDEGRILEPEFFISEAAESGFEVNTKISNYSADIFQVIWERVENFQNQQITVEKGIFENLPMTEAEITDLIENLHFNDYIDEDNFLVDKEAFLVLDVKDFRLALVFYPYRHQILKAVKGLIEGRKSGFYVLSKESFGEIGDRIVGDLIYEGVKVEYLDDDGRIKSEKRSFFLEADNLAEFALNSDFSDQQREIIFRAIANIVSNYQQFQFQLEILDEWDFNVEEREELIELLLESGYLLENGYIPESKIDYFLNVNNALVFNLDKFEDYNKDIFFAIHGFAKTLNAAIGEISQKVSEIGKAQEMVVLDACVEIFGLDRDILRVVLGYFFGGQEKFVEEFMVPVLAVVDGEDRITEEPKHNYFNLTYRRIQQFAVLVSILRLSRKEVEVILDDQDIVEKFPEKLILPGGVDGIDALLELEGIIYLFKDSKFWIYDAQTYGLLSGEELEVKLVEVGYSQVLASRIAGDNNLGSLSEYFSEISHIDAAFVDKDGKSFIFAGGNSYSKEKGSTRWVKEVKEWGLVESDFEQPEYIDGTFGDREGKTYLFFGDQYVRYSDGNYDFVDEGYPLEIVGNWEREHNIDKLPPEFHKSLDASFQGTDGKTYLFKDDNYFCSNGSNGSSQVGPIAETWGRVKNNFDDTEKIDAAYVDGGKYFLFCGDQVIVYQNCLENHGVIVESGFPQKIESYYPNLPPEFKNGIDAAFKGEDGKIHLFKENMVVSFNLEDDSINSRDVKQDWGIVPNPIATDGRVDAAFVGLDGLTYVFSGNQYIRYSGEDYSQVDQGFPRTIQGDWGGLISVDAAFILDGKTYLFGRDSTQKVVYVRYSTNDYWLPDENYPQEPNDNWWNLPFSLVEEGAAFDHIDAIFNAADDKVYLFSQGQFIYFDNKQRWWSEPQSLTQYWDSIPFESIDAAFTGKDGKTYLFSGTEYLRYGGENYNQVEDRYPNITNRYWGNTLNHIAKTGRVDSGVVVRSETQSRGYKLDLRLNEILPTQGKNLVAIAKLGDEYRVRIFDSNGEMVLERGGNDFSVGNILREKIDVALEKPFINPLEAEEIISGVTSNLNLSLELVYTYLFSGDQYFRYQGNQYDVVEPGYPKNISSDLHLEPRFENLENPWLGRIDAAFADRRHIYLFREGQIHVVSEKLYETYSYNDFGIEQINCAFLEDSSLYIEEVEEADNWNHYSSIEGQVVQKTLTEPPTLRNVPDKFKTGLDAVLHGVDKNIYLFKGTDCFNINLNKEYPLQEEWGRVENNIYVNKTIDAGFVGRDGKTYLFSENQYITYSGDTYIGQEIEGHPQPIAENWGGLTSVALALVKDEITYLFEKPDQQGNSRYLRYSTDDYSQPDSGFPQIADVDFWQIPQQYSQNNIKDFLQVNAALFENDNMFLISGKDYLQFNNSQNTWTYPKPVERIWRDIPFDGDTFDNIKTAFTGKDGKTYFFSDQYYITYDGTKFTQPRTIKDDWGLIDNNFVNNGLQNKIDAAFVFQNQITYLFSGDQYVRYSTPDYRYVDEGYPKFISESLRNELGFSNLPEQFADSLSNGVNETDKLIDAVVSNNRHIYIFMDNHCHVVSQNLSQSYDIEILGRLKNSIVEENHVDAAFVNDRGETFLFSGDNYVRYSQDNYEYVDDGYPKAIATSLSSEVGMSQFAESFKYDIDAAMIGADGNIYLFKGEHYQSSVDSEPRPIKDKWGKIQNNFIIENPDNSQYDSSIDAAIASADGKIYLFKGDQYIRYSESHQEFVDEGFPRSIKDNWGNLPVRFEQSVDAGFVLEGKTYFVKGDEYVRYSDSGYQFIDSIYPQNFSYRWGNWADFLLNDIHTITRFKRLQDNYSHGDYSLVDFLYSEEISHPYQMLAGIFDWDIDDLKWLKRNNGFLRSDDFLEVEFDLEMVIKLFDIFEVIKKMGASPKEVYEDVWLNMYPPTNLKLAADTLYKFLGLVNS